MMHQWRLLATAIMFLTRLPVGQAASGKPEEFASSTQYFPLVGVLVGALLSLVFIAADQIWTSNIAVGLVLLAAVLLTGGFHEDGLADVADSAGAWTQERKLDIMRDSRIGTYGSLALVLVLLLKYAVLTSLAETSWLSDSSAGTTTWSVAATLVLAHVLARWSILPMTRYTAYAREQSSNKVFADGVTSRRLLIGSLISLAVVVICSIELGAAAYGALLVTVAAIWLSRLWYLRAVGGITGDCLGATNQLVELLVYLCIAGATVQ